MAGYDWTQGKSNNAVWAEDEGLRVKSKITRPWLQDGGINESAAFIKWLIDKGRISADEFHHTSKFFNTIGYYSTETIKETLERLEKTQLPALRKMYNSKELRKLDGYRFEEAVILIGKKELVA